MNNFKINYENIEKYIEKIIINNEIFDKNYIFELTVNFCKHSQIQISEQDVKEIIKSTLNLCQSQKIIEDFDDEIYIHKNELDYFSNPIEKVIERTELPKFDYNYDIN